MRRMFRVAVKAAVYHKDRVLVIHMDKDNDYGLPGGHIEEGESPDEAIARELMEECGVACDNLERLDFFLHSNGKVILAYVGTIDAPALASTQGNDEGIPKWLTREEFEQITIEPNYREFVLRNWVEI